MRVRIASSAEDRAACFAIRHTVFVVEQNVPEDEELDDLEDACTHFVALDGDDQPVGTARLWITPEGDAKAQRVAVLAEVRGRGVGVALMNALETEARRRGARKVVLAAQVSALGFYERLGFTAHGELFLDAGILHRTMEKGLA